MLRSCRLRNGVRSKSCPSSLMSLSQSLSHCCPKKRALKLIQNVARLNGFSEMTLADLVFRNEEATGSIPVSSTNLLSGL